ncbi:MAG TPA: hypothetical protein VK177_17740 [Flavobacteriales bacterium]|nr:hypothetical protein [Flavobacteriales bacterium]
MIAISLEKKVSTRKRAAEAMIENLKIYGFIKPMQYLYRNKGYDQKQKYLTKLEKGTVGYDVAQFLNDEKLGLIPKFEGHDLKHVILGFGRTSEEELKMQAYLLGNGNYSPLCLLFLLTAVLMPSSWKSLKRCFLKGQKSPSILHLKLNDCMNIKTAELRRIYCSVD